MTWRRAFRGHRYYTIEHTIYHCTQIKMLKINKYRLKHVPEICRWQEDQATVCLLEGGKENRKGEKRDPQS